MAFQRLHRRHLFLSIATVCFLLITACGNKLTPTPEPVLASRTPSATIALTPTSPATASPTVSLAAQIEGSYATPSARQTLTADQPAKTASPTPWPFTPDPASLDTPTPSVATPIARENTPVPQSGMPIRPDNASRVVELARWGKGTVKDTAYSPDGDVLAVATNLGIYFYNNQQAVVAFIETDQPVVRLAFSPKDDLLAAGSSRGTVLVWSWREKRLIKTIPTELKQGVLHIAFSPNGESLGYSGLTDYPAGQVTVLKVADYSSIFQTTVTYPGTFQFAPDGQSIYTAGGSVEKYRFADGTVQAHWELPKPEEWEVVNNMALSSDEKVMVVSSNFRIYLWNLKDPAPFYSFEGTDDIHNGHWTYKADTCHFFVDGGGDRYFSYAISPDNQRLVVLGGNGYFEVRRLRDGAIIATSPEKTKRGQADIFVHQAVFHPSRPELAVRYSPGPIEIVNLDSMAVQGTITGHTEEYSALAFSPSNSSERAYLAAGASDPITRIWNIQTGQRAMDLDDQALSIAFSADGKYLAWGSKDWSFTLLNMINGKKLGPINAHQDWVSAVAITADQRTLITGSYDCTIRIWDIREDGTDISPQRVLGGTEESQISQVTNLVLSRDEAWLLGMSSHMVFRYHLKTQQLDSNTKIGGIGIAIAPDSRTIAVSGGDGLSIWNIETLEKVDEWPNVISGQVTYSPDGHIIAIGNYEGLIQLVDGKTGEVLNTLEGHHGEINDLKFSQDGHLLASTARDGTVRVWGIP